MPFCIRCGATVFREFTDWMLISAEGHTRALVLKRDSTDGSSVQVHFDGRTYIAGLCPNCVIPDDRLKNTPEGTNLVRYIDEQFTVPQLRTR